MTKKLIIIGLIALLAAALALSAGILWKETKLEGKVTDGTTFTVPTNVAYTIAAGGANVCEVTITLKAGGSGATVAGSRLIKVWLSDASTGVGLTGTSASGTVTAKAASGEVVGTYTAKKALLVQTKADGTFILEITDTAKTHFYVCAEIPLTGKYIVSTQLATASYGS